MCKGYYFEKIKIAEELLSYSKRSLAPQLIFLIGASVKQKNSLRSKLNIALSEHVKYFKPIQIFYPEDLFPELLYDKSYDLLTLENKLAQSVHAVVMCIESAGSLAELGAFSNCDLKDKLIVIQEKRFKKVKSFVTTGPIQFIEHHTNGKVIYHNYKDDDVLSLAKEIRSDVARYYKKIKVEQELSNPIFSIEYVLKLIYCFGSLSKNELLEIFQTLEKKRLNKSLQNTNSNMIVVNKLKVSFLNKLIKENDDIQVYDELKLSKESILTSQAALTYLSRQGSIKLRSTRFHLTEKGKKLINDSVSVDPKFSALLDDLRIRFINLSFSNQKIVN